MVETARAKPRTSVFAGRLRNGGFNLIPLYPLDQSAISLTNCAKRLGKQTSFSVCFPKSRRRDSVEILSRQRECTIDRFLEFFTSCRSFVLLQAPHLQHLSVTNSRNPPASPRHPQLSPAYTSNVQLGRPSSRTSRTATSYRTAH